MELGILIILALAFILRIVILNVRGEPEEPPPQKLPTDPDRKAVTKAIKVFDLTDWSWKDRSQNIIRARKDNRLYQDYMVVFDDSRKQVTKLIRMRDMESLDLEPIKVELTEDALLSYYEAVLSEDMQNLQELADAITSYGERWVKGDPYNNGEKPTKKELRMLRQAFESMGFKVDALNFSDGSLKLGLKEESN